MSLSDRLSGRGSFHPALSGCRLALLATFREPDARLHADVPCVPGTASARMVPLRWTLLSIASRPTPRWDRETKLRYRVLEPS